MDTNRASFFYPSLDDQSSRRSEFPAFLILCSMLLMFAVLGYVTLDLDHPIGIATDSRALYVDGGFYSDAAQNWVKFGQWSFQYDSRHWPGAPFLAVFRSQVFSWFGVSLETARLSSIYLSIISLIVFFFIVRTSFKPFMALFLTVASALTISFVTHARSALAEPTAACFALLAFLVFVRIKNKNVAIPLSVAFAFISFLSKLYFLHALAAIVVLWSFELLILPLYHKRALEKRAILIFGLCLASILFFYVVSVHIFQDEIATFLSMNSTKKPVFDPIVVFERISRSLNLLGHYTKIYFFSWAIVLGILWLIGVYLLCSCYYQFIKNKGKDLKQKIQPLGRAEAAMATWLFIGLALIGNMGQSKAHYYFFVILPLCFIGAISLKWVIPKRFQTAAVGVLILVHGLFQIPYYVQWSERTQKTALVDGSRDMVDIIHQQSDSSVIPVMGEYSAQLALFSDRMLSLDAKWNALPNIPFCQRLEHWRPKFHVSIDGRNHRSDRRIKAYQKCDLVSHVREVKRYSLLKPKDDEFVLTRIYYRE